MYEDNRQEDTMEDWDEEKLKEVVDKKHGERERKGMPTTDIICKHFIDALESNKYGWFWDCPNGGDKCHYRHCLPPGFVLNKDRKKKDKKDDITIEELVEIERAKLGYHLTKITLQLFLEWKRKKLAEKADRDQKETDRKKAEFKAGKNVGLSGREMFTFNPDLAIDEDMEDGETAYMDYDSEDDDDDEERGIVYKEITLEALMAEAKAADGTGTQIDKREFNIPIDDTQAIAATGGTEDTIESPPIDETLFEDDFDDLDDLHEELDSVSLDK
ncbi:unnamed protein product [Medioppia subpectinata]|uniref:C3H1-type domain-containing protein n=1 Tax=Medioppia subpectinata TaxID=1979941 RepID=A0A7R9KYK1_9ACAR|nr:unnamed protein product [Medioppia subpectinata]CAG2111938.1 unnamed protein product [Medioppia subpectinata]